MFDKLDAVQNDPEDDQTGEALRLLQEDSISICDKQPEEQQDRQPDEQEQSVSAKTAKMLKDYKEATGEAKTALFTPLNKFADKLVIDAAEELADRNKLPTHVLENYQTSLQIKEALLGPSKELIPALDHLTNFLQPGRLDGRSIPYQEKALEILKAAMPNDNIQLSMRSSELARQFYAIGNTESGNKYFEQANKLWQHKPSAETSDRLETQGDLSFKNAQYRDAIFSYSDELSLSDRPPRKQADMTSFFDNNFNPRNARLHQKLGDAYLANGQLDKANTAYQSASNYLTTFSERCGNGKVLPEQLKASASMLSLQCKYSAEYVKKQGENPGVNPHLLTAAQIAKEMVILESRLDASGSPVEAKDFYKADPELIPFLDKAAEFSFSLGDFDGSAALCEQKYSVQTAQKADTAARIETLITTAHQYFKGGHADKAIKTCDKAEKIASEEYGKADPRFATTMKNIAQHYSSEKHHQQALDVLNRLYLDKLLTDQNKSPEELISTLNQIADQHFFNKNLNMAVKSYEQVVEIVGDNKNLFNLLKPPEFAQSTSAINWRVRFLPLEEQAKTSPAAKDKYAQDLLALSNVLYKAAQKQYSSEKTKNLSLENYTNAVRAMNISLSHELKVDYTMLTEMADMINIKDKFDPEILNNDELKILSRELKKQVETLMQTNYKNNDPVLVPILDNLAQYERSEIIDDKAIPYMKQALAIEESRGVKVADLEKRHDEIAYMHSSKHEPVQAIDIYKGLLKKANDEFNNQDNEISMHALNRLSGLLAGMNTRVGNPLPKEELLKYQQEALQYKEQEIAMATRMNASMNKNPDKNINADANKNINTNQIAPYNLASLLCDKASIQLSMGQKEDGLKTLQNALEIDKNLLLSPSYVDQMVSACQTPTQAEQFLRQAIEAQKKISPTSDSTHFTQLGLVGLLTEQNKLDEAQKMLKTMVEEIPALIKAAETKEDSKAYYKQMDHMASTLETLAPLYEKQNQPANAEATFIRLGDVAKDCQDDRIHYMKASLEGLVRVYTAQGKEDQALKAKEDLARLPNF